MITTANITMQFGSKPLFENISAKFGNGNRYGLIGANGCGKSTFMKILSGKLTPSSGNVSMAPGTKLGILSQDQFAFEEFSVVDTVIMGDRELWEVKQERDAIYSKAEMSEEDGMRVADLETQFAEMDGYTAEARAGDILNSAGIDESYHFGLMKEVAPGKKVRVLLAQALFAEPDILLLDEPTNNLDIYTISWLAEELNKRKSTMLIISHDRHFLNSVCTHMADIDYGELRVYPGNYDDYIQAAMLVQEQLHAENAKKSAEIEELQSFVARFSANASKAKQATSRARRLEKIELAEVKASSRRKPYIVFNQHKKLHRLAITLEELGHSYPDLPLFDNANLLLEAGQRLAIIGENGAGKTTSFRMTCGLVTPTKGQVLLDGTDVTNWPLFRRARMGLGYLPQDDSVFGKLTVAQNLQVVLEYLGIKRSERKQRIHELLDQFGIADRHAQIASTLSGGERRRLEIARCLASRPSLILLDEPFAGVDPVTINSIQHIIVRLREQGISILLTDHREQETLGVTDRAYVISQGKVLVSGTPSEVLSDRRAQEVYFGQQDSSETSLAA